MIKLLVDAMPTKPEHCPYSIEYKKEQPDERLCQIKKNTGVKNTTWSCTLQEPLATPCPYFTAGETK